MMRKKLEDIEKENEYRISLERDLRILKSKPIKSYLDWKNKKFEKEV